MTYSLIRQLRHLYRGLACQAARFEAALYAVLRISFGIVLFTHGLPKALGDAHGSMADPMMASTRLIGEGMGLPFAPQLALLVMLLETIGAVMLVLGVMTRGIALIFVVEMVAISVALGPTWPWIDRGIEYPVLMGFLALYIVARGGGIYAVDSKVAQLDPR